MTAVVLIYGAGLALGLVLTLSGAFSWSIRETPRVVWQRVGQGLLSALTWPVAFPLWVVRTYRRDEWST